jgi:hypothetical protein
MPGREVRPNPRLHRTGPAESNREFKVAEPDRPVTVVVGPQGMESLMRCLVSIVWACTFAGLPALRAGDKPIDVPIESPQFRLIGRLGEPLGKVLTLQGVVIDGPSKGYEGGPNLRVQRINGRATLDDILIKLQVLFGRLSDLEVGKTYELKGYQTGEFVGIPDEANENGAQSTAFHCAIRFMVSRHAKIAAIQWAPEDFVDRPALLGGMAESRDRKAYITGPGWRLLADPTAAWPKEVEGKAVEGLGTVRKADRAGEFRLEKAESRLVRLEDQVGRPVSIRGTAWSVNGHWWLKYRGTELYVDGMKDLPGWAEACPHGQPVLITGVLDEALLPDLRQLTRKEHPDQKKYFVVRKPAWKPLQALLSPERVD